MKGPGAGWVLVLTLAAAACADTETVFVQQPLFEEPAAAAQGFLGYSDVTEGRPVCGNCHVGKFGEWRHTAHSNAWDDLQASGHASASCEPCHTVNSNGNWLDLDKAGWTAVADERYQDVQCESCHGPGLEHVTNPDATQPLAPLVVGLDLTQGCGECHQGAHNPFVEEWSQSSHGDMNPYPQGREACVQCHEARGIFAAWGVRASFAEQDTTGFLPISCPVCHDPHDATNPKQLRFPIDVPNVDTNLCMKCHHKRGEPDPTTFRGPHSPQGPLLVGEAGWRPPNFEYPNQRIVGTHGTEANPRLCATCHVSGLNITDPVTGDFVFHATGHLFKAIPCLDDQGIPTVNDDCALTGRTFDACVNSGCHGTQDVARSALIVARQRIADLVAELEGLLAQVPTTEFDDTDNLYTTAEGARFNAELGAMAGSPIHNPFLMEALLTASIRQVQDDYGVTPAPDLSLENVLSPG
jgi:predicted CXXCH cytochrome family protein